MNLAGSIRLTKCGTLIILVFIILTVYYAAIGERKITKYFHRSFSEVNLRKLLISSIQAAVNGGREIIEISKTADFNIKSKGKTEQGANDPVTVADFNSHCVMVNNLHRMFPNLKIISEEDNSGHPCPDVKLFDLDPNVVSEMSLIPDEIISTDNLTVWIDPLDATQEFTEKMFEYVTTMVCVAIKGRPIIGVIHNPFTKFTAWTWLGKISSHNLQDIKKPKLSANHPVIIVSRSHPGEVHKMVKNTFGEEVNIVSAAGAGYKSLQVAFNNATAYFHSTEIKKWDICAGDAIISSLGGKMTDLHGKLINYASNFPLTNENGLLASLLDVEHDNIIKKIQKIKTP